MKRNEVMVLHKQCIVVTLTEMVNIVIFTLRALCCP
jgi:hypothetical protein